jgi:hypothetical protein
MLGDLEGSRPKTESMEVRKQPRLALPTEPQIRQTLGAKCHVCIDCNRGYSTAHQNAPDSWQRWLPLA